MPINDGLSYSLTIAKKNKALKQYLPSHQWGRWTITKRGPRIWSSLWVEIEGEQYRVNLPMPILHKYHQFYVKYRGKFPVMAQYMQKRLRGHSFKYSKENHNHHHYVFDDVDDDVKKVAYEFRFIIGPDRQEEWKRFQQAVRVHTSFKNINDVIWAMIREKMKIWEASENV